MKLYLCDILLICCLNILRTIVSDSLLAGMLRM